ncbi:MAG: hypothetical protein GF311_07085 [Candidatus Lokiarchaeota archaeon]|nr:hypothetical protein [Candidatus Lokiarchaeota archaeon]
MSLEIALLDGLTATLIILSSVIFGSLSFINAKKMGAKLLYYAGAMMIFIGLFWLGPFTEFLSVLLFNTNLNPKSLYGILSYVWVAPAIIVAMYLGSELLVPEKKKIIVGIYAILGVIFDILIIFFNDQSFNYPIGPEGTGTPGVDLINGEFVRTFPTFWLVAVFLVSVLIFESFGFGLKAKQATGELRKKFVFLSVGFTVFVVCGALDSILSLPLAIGFVRIVMATFALWMYLGLKT